MSQKQEKIDKPNEPAIKSEPTPTSAPTPTPTPAKRKSERPFPIKIFAFSGSNPEPNFLNQLTPTMNMTQFFVACTTHCPANDMDKMLSFGLDYIKQNDSINMAVADARYNKDQLQAVEQLEKDSEADTQPIDD